MTIPDRVPVPYDYIPTTETPAAYVFVATEQDRPSIVVRTSSETVKIFEAFHSRIDELDRKLALITSLLQQRTSDVLEHDSPPAAEMPEAEAMAAAKAFFDSSDDETIYPSDVAEKLGIPYDQALIIVQKLEKNGQITKA